MAIGSSEVWILQIGYSLVLQPYDKKTMWIKTVNRRTKWPRLPVCKTFKLPQGISMDIQMVLNETTSSHLRWGHYVGRSPASSSAQSLASTNRPAACFEQPGRTSPHFHAVEIQKWQAGWLWVCPWVTPTSTKRQPNPLSYLPWYALLKGTIFGQHHKVIDSNEVAPGWCLTAVFNMSWQPHFWIMFLSQTSIF